MAQYVSAKHLPAFGGLLSLRSRRAGARRYVDLHIQFRSGTSLERAHELAHEMRDAIETALPRTEVLIQKAMSELMQGRTNFVIAHRLSTIRDADEILVFDHGRIVERGSFADLLVAQGKFSNLVETQITLGATASAVA